MKRLILGLLALLSPALALAAPTQINLNSQVQGTLPVAKGGTGTSTPAIVAGTNVTVSGTWPNQTINAAGGGSPGGSTTQLQYNNAGAFAGAVGITTTGTELAIAPAANATPLTVSGYSVTGSGTAKMINTSGTLNTTGIVDVDFQNITNTASNSSSTLIRRQVGGSDKFKVYLDGSVSMGGFTSIGAISGWTMFYNGPAPGGFAAAINTSGVLSVPDNGGGIQWASFPTNTADIYLSRVSQGVAKLSSNSTQGGAIVTDPKTFANLPTGTDGARAFITDGASALSSSTVGTAAAGGGSNHVPVYYDSGSTSWKYGG